VDGFASFQVPSRHTSSHRVSAGFFFSNHPLPFFEIRASTWNWRVFGDVPLPSLGRCWLTVGSSFRSFFYLGIRGSFSPISFPLPGSKKPFLSIGHLFFIRDHSAPNRAERFDIFCPSFTFEDKSSFFKAPLYWPLWLAGAAPPPAVVAAPLD